MSRGGSCWPALTAHGPALSEPMIRAILHPLTLVEVRPSDQATLDLIRVAASVVPLVGLTRLRRPGLARGSRR